MKNGFCAFLLFFTFACSSPVPKGVLPPAKMYPVVRDIMKTDEFINGYLMRDSTINLKQKRSNLYAHVFKIHNTNRKQFYRSFTYYEQHPDLLKILFDSLNTGVRKKEPKKFKPVIADTALQ